MSLPRPLALDQPYGPLWLLTLARQSVGLGGRFSEREEIKIVAWIARGSERGRGAGAAWEPWWLAISRGVPLRDQAASGRVLGLTGNAPPHQGFAVKTSCAVLYGFGSVGIRRGRPTSSVDEPEVMPGTGPKRGGRRAWHVARPKGSRRIYLQDEAGGRPGPGRGDSGNAGLRTGAAGRGGDAGVWSTKGDSRGARWPVAGSEKPVGGAKIR